MAFSGGVKLGDLDDFIAASQDCVKPLIQAAGGGSGSAKLDATADGLRASAVAPPVEVPQVQRPNLIKSKKSTSNPKAEIGQVTLSDCLACSGCVTSAETVLLQAQSVDEFLRRVSEAAVTVVTISPEARASVALSSGEAPLTSFQRLATAVRRLGAAYVLESSASEALALAEGKAEFIRRFRAAASSPLPLLTSHCPGWTCYAEKVVDPAVLPHLAPLRPPQEIQGRLVKTLLLDEHNRRRLHRWWRCRSPLFAGECAWWVRRSWGGSGGPEPLGPADVYHVAVQPCFDRKIEAARPSFEVAEGVREVDTVLTTTELLELVLRSSGASPPASAQPSSAETAARNSEALAALADCPPCPLESEGLTDVLLRDLGAGRPAGAPLLCAVGGNAESGGFAEHIFREAARELFSREVKAPLEFATKQNEDMREVALLDSKGQALLKFVSAYGFRNIQNVIKRITRTSGGGPVRECGHFVEIMACPGGCLNGGGQPSAPAPAPAAAANGVPPKGATRPDRRQRLGDMEALLHSAPGTAVVAPEEHPLLLPIYQHILHKVGAEANGKANGMKANGVAHSPSNGRTNGSALGGLIGHEAVRRWLAADWRSLKVDEEGKAIIGTSELKW